MTILTPYTAILSIHLVNDIVGEGTAFGSLFYPQVVERDVIARSNEAFAAVREADGLVVHVCIALAPDYSDSDPNIPLLAMAEQAGALQVGSEGASLLDDVNVNSSDATLTHIRPGPFTGSELENLLRERGITDVIVSGVATNASVDSTVRQASDLGFKTYLLEDACSAATPEAHAAAVETAGLFARIITTADL